MTPSHTARIHRAGVSLVFMLHGAVFATWASRIPDVQQKIELNDQQLGLVLLGLSVGVVTALPLIGGVIDRFGSRRVTVVAGMLHSAVLILLAQAFNFTTLWLALFAFGFVASSMDVAMNTQGVQVEEALGASVMSSLHAMFSIGIGLGGIIGGQLLGLSVEAHFTRMAVLFVLLNAALYALLLPDTEKHESERAPAFSLPPRSLWLIGAVAFISTVGEGTMVDWSAKYMRDVVQTSDQLAAYGLTAFSVTMTAGRFLGDSVIRRFDAATVVRASATSALIGLALLVGWPTTIGALAGFAFVGLGLATVIPLAFSVAGRMPDVPTGVGIAGVATIGYAGFLAGPPLIGILAEQFTLRTSMAALLLLVLPMLALANAFSSD